MESGRQWCPLVSIQLVSPASGESKYHSNGSTTTAEVSIQLVSPASGEEEGKRMICLLADLFPFN